MSHAYEIANTRIVLRNETGKIVAEIDFPRQSSDVIAITHTLVDPSLRGQGIANEMMALLIDKAQKEHLKIKPICSFAGAYFEKHPDLASLIVR